MTSRRWKAAGSSRSGSVEQFRIANALSLGDDDSASPLAHSNNLVRTEKSPWPSKSLLKNPN
jgi:hypothetical protein